MLGPIGSELMNIFRLLSPAEIDRYLEHNLETQLSGSMAANGEELVFDEHNPQFVPGQGKNKKKFPKDHQAKIIPLHAEENSGEQKLANTEEEEENSFDDEETLDKAEMLKAKLKSNGLESIGILSAAALRKIEDERLKKESKKRDSTTAFLIKQREKMRNSKRKLIEQHAYKSYQSNAAQEFYEEIVSDDEDDISSSTKGILINKKHY